MSICDKIMNIGNTLEDNLNNRGVDCTFGIGTGEQNIYDMAELITKQNLMGIGDANIQIIPNRPYVTSGETIDVTVRLLDGVGNPLINKIITISDGTNSYNGTTDNDGIYTLFNQTITTTTTYTVTYGTETASCLVKYCVFVDYGVENNYNSNWKKNEYLSINRSATETTLTQTVSGSNGGFYETQNNSFNLPSTCVIEFDCYINTSRTDDGGWMNLRTNSTVRRWIKLESFGLQYGEWHHYKIELDGTSSKVTIDGISNTVTLTQAVNNFVFNLRDDVTTSGGKLEIKYKNFRIR